MVSDTVPKRVVSSVVGLGGMAGAIGGIIMAPVIGHVLQWTHSYFIPFAIAATAYLIALGLIQFLLPHLEPMRFSPSHSEKE